MAGWLLNQIIGFFLFGTNAPRDGSVVLFTADSLGTQRVMGISEMSYDDFSPISVVANDPKVIVVAKDSPYQTIGELLDEIKARPTGSKAATKVPAFDVFRAAGRPAGRRTGGRGGTGRNITRDKNCIPAGIML